MTKNQALQSKTNVSNFSVDDSFEISGFFCDKIHLLLLSTSSMCIISVQLLYSLNNFLIRASMRKFTGIILEFYSLE